MDLLGAYSDGTRPVNAPEYGGTFLLKTKLHILLVEDDVHDVELIARQLKTSGCDVSLTRVQTETEFRLELEAEPPDVILSDHGLPAFSGFKALEIVRETYPTLPFIFVSGSNDQNMVAQMHDAGATDYVFKNDILDLWPAVREALKETHPPVLIAQPVNLSPDGIAYVRLRLCPSCLRARDEKNAPVDFLDYFRTHREIVVLHELCEACIPITRLN
jgi:CheY-like chemotaxis protein